MEILMKRPLYLIGILVLAALVALPVTAQTAAGGFELRLVVDDTGVLNEPSAMDIDPLTGDLFVDNFSGQNSLGTVGQIIRINPSSGDSHEVVPISNGFSLAFAPNGTLYFGVRNFLMATWDPRTGVAKKFAIIPGLRGIQVSDDGRIFAGEGSFGPRGLFKDAVLEVDPRDGFFKPLATASEMKESIGVTKDSLGNMAADDQGNVFMSFKEGTIFRKDAAGNYVQLIKRPEFIGGLNQQPMRFKDGVVYMYDIAAGVVFGMVGDAVHVLAFGDELRGGNSDQSGIATDGTNIYLCGDYNKIYHLKPVSGTVRQALTTAHGAGSLSGVVTDEQTGGPLAGATIKLNTGPSTTTDETGHWSMSGIPATAYEMTIIKDGYLDTYRRIKVEPELTLELNQSVSTGLPSFLAPGLAAEVWTLVPGTSDIKLGPDGNVYSMDIFASTIVKHLRDPATEAELSQVTFATGDGLDGAWYFEIDDAGTVFCANGNDGVFRLPSLPDNQSHILTRDPVDPTVVRNQLGQNMVIDLSRDSDGFAVVDVDVLMISTGSGGDPNPCAPDGTVNTIVRKDLNNVDACGTLFSRGIPCTGGPSLFDNNDQMTSDPFGRLLVGNRGGNVVRINSEGCADWWLPGDGDGVPEHEVGSFAGIGLDPEGNIFIRGGRSNPDTLAIRMVTEDKKFYDVARGIRQCWAGLTFNEDGSSLYYTDLDLIVRIYSTDGRPIVQVLLDNVTPE